MHFCIHHICVTLNAQLVADTSRIEKSQNEDENAATEWKCMRKKKKKKTLTEFNTCEDYRLPYKILFILSCVSQNNKAYSQEMNHAAKKADLQP